MKQKTFLIVFEALSFGLKQNVDKKYRTQALSLWRRPARQTLSKDLDISSARARVAPDLLKP